MGHFVSFPEGEGPERVERLVLNLVDPAVDAGAVSQLISLSLSTLDGGAAALFNSDPLIDYRSQRPLMNYKDGRLVDVRRSGIVLSHASDVEGQPFLHLHGAEPDFQWDALLTDMIDVIEKFGVKSTFSFTAIPSATPHTRPADMVVRAAGHREGHPVFEADFWFAASFADYLEYHTAKLGISHTNVAVRVPVYLAGDRYFTGAAGALGLTSSLSGLYFPLGDLEQAAAEEVEAYASVIEANEDLAQFIDKLEKDYDANGAVQGYITAPKPEMRVPTADEIGKAAEQFLAGVASPRASASEKSFDPQGLLRKIERYQGFLPGESGVEAVFDAAVRMEQPPEVGVEAPASEKAEEPADSEDKASDASFGGEDVDCLERGVSESDAEDSDSPDAEDSESSEAGDSEFSDGEDVDSSRADSSSEKSTVPEASENNNKDSYGTDEGDWLSGDTERDLPSDDGGLEARGSETVESDDAEPSRGDVADTSEADGRSGDGAEPSTPGVSAESHDSRDELPNSNDEDNRDELQPGQAVEDEAEFAAATGASDEADESEHATAADRRISGETEDHEISGEAESSESASDGSAQESETSDLAGETSDPAKGEVKPLSSLGRIKAFIENLPETPEYLRDADVPEGDVNVPEGDANALEGEEPKEIPEPGETLEPPSVVERSDSAMLGAQLKAGEEDPNEEGRPSAGEVPSNADDGHPLEDDDFQDGADATAEAALSGEQLSGNDSGSIGAAEAGAIHRDGEEAGCDAQIEGGLLITESEVIESMDGEMADGANREPVDVIDGDIPEVIETMPSPSEAELRHESAEPFGESSEFREEYSEDDVEYGESHDENGQGGAEQVESLDESNDRQGENESSELQWGYGQHDFPWGFGQQERPWGVADFEDVSFAAGDSTQSADGSDADASEGASLSSEEDVEELGSWPVQGLDASAAFPEGSSPAASSEDGAAQEIVFSPHVFDGSRSAGDAPRISILERLQTLVLKENDVQDAGKDSPDVPDEGLVSPEDPNDSDALEPPESSAAADDPGTAADENFSSESSTAEGADVETEGAGVEAESAGAEAESAGTPGRETDGVSDAQVEVPLTAEGQAAALAGIPVGIQGSGSNAGSDTAVEGNGSIADASAHHPLEINRNAAKRRRGKHSE
mgnify:FL=1